MANFTEAQAMLLDFNTTSVWQAGRVRQWSSLASKAWLTDKVGLLCSASEYVKRSPLCNQLVSGAGSCLEVSASFVVLNHSWDPFPTPLQHRS